MKKIYQIVFELALFAAIWAGIAVLAKVNHTYRPLSALVLKNITPTTQPMLPGKFTGTLLLSNLSKKPVKNIHFTTSCFCTKVLGAQQVALLPAKTSLHIVYQIKCIVPGHVDEAITARNACSEVYIFDWLF